LCVVRTRFQSILTKFLGKLILACFQARSATVEERDHDP